MIITKKRLFRDDRRSVDCESADRGATIVNESLTTFYDTREIDVEDCYGYRLCFAQDTSTGG